MAIIVAGKDTDGLAIGCYLDEVMEKSFTGGNVKSKCHRQLSLPESVRNQRAAIDGNHHAGRIGAGARR